MKEKKLNLRTQLFLESIPCLLVFIIILIDKLDFLSSTVKNFLGIIPWVILIITWKYHLKKKESLDELANTILGKVNGICIHVLLVLLVAFAFFIRLSSFSYTNLSLNLISDILFLLIFSIMSLKYLLFSYYDRKEI